MLRLPPSSSPLREMFEAEDLVNFRSLPLFPEALRACQCTVQQPNIRTVQAIVRRANDELWLIQVGKRGGWRRLWNFGNPYKGCEQF